MDATFWVMIVMAVVLFLPYLFLLKRLEDIIGMNTKAFLELSRAVQKLSDRLDVLERLAKRE